jgi:hypothetical protein
MTKAVHLARFKRAGELKDAEGIIPLIGRHVWLRVTLDVYLTAGMQKRRHRR